MAATTRTKPARAASAVRQWLDERFGWDGIVAAIEHKTVPRHRFSYWYFFGGMTLFLFGVQIVTGLLLLLYYRASANEAYESVQFIMTQVHFGWLIRSIHAWSANLMIFTALVHMFSVFFQRSYRKPRELTWVSGMLLLFVVLGFAFSGYLLPWNTLSLFATKVGTEIPGQMPVVGRGILLFLRGGDDVTGATLSRFFAFHVAFLPAIAGLLVAAHVLLIQRFGMSVPPGTEAAWKAKPLREREIRFFPNFLLRELMAWYAALAVLGGLAAYAPWSLGTKADLFASAPAGIKPEWYFLFMFQTLRILPAKFGPIPGDLVGLLGFGAAFAVWTLLPFIDTGNSPRRRHFLIGAGVFVVAYVTAMTLIGHAQ